MGKRSSGMARYISRALSGITFSGGSATGVGVSGAGAGGAWVAQPVANAAAERPTELRNARRPTAVLVKVMVGLVVESVLEIAVFAGKKPYRHNVLGHGRAVSQVHLP